jgi:uncharacterized membrane protein (GlpM family)
MTVTSFLTSFLIGGLVTALIVGLEESGLRTWSGLAALVPVFTVVSYFFIGASKDAHAVSEHSKFVLFGTLVSWVPYMLVIAYTAPRLGTTRAIGLGLCVFFILAALFVWGTQRYRLFQ